jgi:hypothetical protein
LGKRKTLALGVYPDVALAKARTRCADARRLLADGVDPAQAKREDKQEQIFAAAQTFELVARLAAMGRLLSQHPSKRPKGAFRNLDAFERINDCPAPCR